MSNDTRSIWTLDDVFHGSSRDVEVEAIRAEGLDAWARRIHDDVDGQIAPDGRMVVAPSVAEIRRLGQHWLDSTPVIDADETRLIVGGLEIPPYEGAVAYVRNTLGEHGVRYSNGHTDWMGQAGQAYGDETVELHPDEMEG